VEHEGHPFHRSELLEDDEQGHPHCIAQEGCLLGVDPIFTAHDRLGYAGLERGLSPGSAGPQHVEAHPSNDRDEPALEVVDAARVGSTEP
jgi:hypothetical protein